MASEQPEADQTTGTAKPALTEQAATEREERADREASAHGQAAAAEVRLGDLRFECLANAHYHQDMERFYDWAHRGAMFVVVASGSSAFAGFGDADAAKIAAAVATLAGLADLVFDLFGKAARHGQLRWRALDIYAESFEPKPDAGLLAARLARLFPDEPPTNETVNSLAYNRAIEAMGKDEDGKIVIAGYKRFFRHVVPFWKVDPTRTIGALKAK
ncbi:hypothetical protein ATO13_08681 [Stappia sp. 22II-S9-Z10]|nr:hypothetical protein ATO13_08681 [Stappia sp. 22II-S9-Z10]